MGTVKGKEMASIAAGIFVKKSFQSLGSAAIKNGAVSAQQMFGAGVHTSSGLGGAHHWDIDAEYLKQRQGKVIFYPDKEPEGLCPQNLKPWAPPGWNKPLWTIGPPLLWRNLSRTRRSTLGPSTPRPTVYSALFCRWTVKR